MKHDHENNKDSDLIAELLKELRTERREHHEMMVMLRRAFSRINAQNKKLFEQRENAENAPSRDRKPNDDFPYPSFIQEEEEDTPEEPEESPHDKRKELAERLHELRELLSDAEPGPVGCTPDFEHYVIDKAHIELMGVTEYDFRQLLRRDFPALIAEQYVKKTLSPMFFGFIVDYYVASSEVEQPLVNAALHSAAIAEETAEQFNSLKPAAAKGAFRLLGRRELAQFFHEQVLDIVQNPEVYQALGIGFPQPFILEGAPGCGKTFAVERLAEYLGWHTVRLTSASLGEGIIHESARKIEEMFEEAEKNAPALVIMDELDAFAPNRAKAHEANTHIKEEVGSLLKCLQRAASQRVLVIGMTNLIESIDPALLRSGRFGTHLHVEAASEEEVEEVLREKLHERKHADFPLTPYVQRLFGHPLADVTHAVEEAAMHAARDRRNSVEEVDLRAALDRIEHYRHTQAERTPIGFLPPAA